MSSLLSNDFIEEYFRVENNITTNNQRFYVDREGQLVYTTPFFTTNELISDNKIVLGNKAASQNVNIVIDSIAFISTNPDIQNYLPLSISLGGLKPQIEFSNVSFVPLNNYKIIVSPRVNLNTVTNSRYSGAINSCFELITSPDILITSILNVVRTGDGTTYKEYYLIKNADPVENVVLEVVNGDTMTTALVDVDDVDFVYGNRYAAVGVAVGNPLIVTDLTSEWQIANITGETYLDLFLADNTTIIVTRVGANVIYRYYTKTRDEYCLINTVTANNLGDVKLVAIYDANDFFTYDGGLIEWRRFVAGFDADDNDVKYIATLDITNVVNHPDNTLLRLYVGGPNRDSPNITIFVYDGDVLYSYFFDQFNPKPVVTHIALQSRPLIKRYKNTAYFYSIVKRSIYLFNLDDNSLVTYPLEELNNLIPRLWEVVNFSDYDMLMGGYPFGAPEILTATRWTNDRPINDVYKVVYNYSERNLPFYLADNFIFTLKLPNNNAISDMEIFKYVIDFRIRYSEASIGKEPAESVGVGGGDRNKRRKFVRQSRTVGDVEKILGYVNQDFTVADFLNIYS